MGNPNQDHNNEETEEVVEENFVWLGKLSAEQPMLKFEGCDDAHVCACDGCSDGHLKLKRATLDADCEDESRHVIELISLDHDENKCEGTLCSLNLNFNDTVALDDMIVSPPTAFRLVKGKGPITIIGNLVKEAEDHEDEEETKERKELIEEIEKQKAENELKRKNESEEVKTNEEPEAKKRIVIKAIVKNNDNSNGKIENAQNLISQIKTDPGYAKLCHYYKNGKTAKKNQFVNWVKNQFQCEVNDWVDQAWKVISKS